MPVIPTKRGGLGAILANAPLLLERLATLTERLTLLLSDKNQESIEGILANTETLSGNLADSLAQDRPRRWRELQVTLRQANTTLASFEKLAGSTDQMLNGEGTSLAAQLRDDAQIGAGRGRRAARARSAMRARPRGSCPKRPCPPPKPRCATCARPRQALRDVTEKINDQGAGALIGGPQAAGLQAMTCRP